MYWVLVSFVSWRLKRVSVEAPLDGVGDGEGAVEDLLAVLLSAGLLAGVHVLVEDVPDVIGQVEVLQQAGEPTRKKVMYTIW